MANAAEWLDWFDKNEDSPKYWDTKTAFFIKQEKDKEFAAEVRRLEALKAKEKDRAFIESIGGISSPTIPRIERQPEPESTEVEPEPKIKPRAESSDFLRGLASGKDYADVQFGSMLEGAGESLGIQGLADYGRDVIAANEAELATTQDDMIAFKDVDILEDPGKFIDWAQQTVGQTLTLTGLSIGTGIAGSVAATALGASAPVAGIAAIGAGALSQIPFFYGGNREEQKEAIEQGLRTEINEGTALLTAIPQATMDVVAERMQLRGGADLISKFLNVRGGLFTTGLKNFSVGALTEVPTEVGQAFLEKLQAGKDITSDEAIDEYIESAAGAVLIGGGLQTTAGVFGIDEGSRIQRAVDQREIDRDAAEGIDSVEKLVEDITDDDVEQITAENLAELTAQEKGLQDLVAEQEKATTDITDTTDTTDITQEEYDKEQRKEMGATTTIERDGVVETKKQDIEEFRAGVFTPEEQAVIDKRVAGENLSGAEAEIANRINVSKEIGRLLAEKKAPATAPATAPVKTKTKTTGTVTDAEKEFGPEVTGEVTEEVTGEVEDKPTFELTAPGQIREEVGEEVVSPTEVSEDQLALDLRDSDEVLAERARTEREQRRKQRRLERTKEELGRGEYTSTDEVESFETFTATETTPPKDLKLRKTTKDEKPTETKKGKAVSKARKASIKDYATAAADAFYGTWLLRKGKKDKVKDAMRKEGREKPEGSVFTAGEMEVYSLDVEEKAIDYFMEEGGASLKYGPKYEELVAEGKVTPKPAIRSTTTEDFVSNNDRKKATKLLKTSNPGRKPQGKKREAETKKQEVERLNRGAAFEYLAGTPRLEDALTFIAFEMAAGTPGFETSRALTYEENAIFAGTGGKRAEQANQWVIDNLDSKTVKAYEKLKAGFKREVGKQKRSDVAYEQADVKVPKTGTYEAKRLKADLRESKTLSEAEIDAYIASPEGQTYMAEFYAGKEKAEKKRTPEQRAEDTKAVVEAIKETGKRKERVKAKTKRDIAKLDLKEVVETFSSLLGGTKIRLVDRLKNKNGSSVNSIFDAEKNILKLDSVTGLNASNIIEKRIKAAQKEANKTQSKEEQAAAEEKIEKTLADINVAKQQIAADLKRKSPTAKEKADEETGVTELTGELEGSFDGQTLYDEFNLPANSVSELSVPVHPLVEQALRQGDIRLALGLLDGYSDNVTESKKDYVKLVKAVAETFPAFLGNTKVEVVNNLKNEAGVKVAGLFDPKTNTIKLDSARGLNTHVLLHELTHALVSATLANKSHPVTKQLTKLYNESKDLLSSAYGRTSLDEFVAEAFSNMAFRSELAGLYPKGSILNGFKRFINTILSFIDRVLSGAKVSMPKFEVIDTDATTLSNVGRLASKILAPAPENRDSTELAANPEKIIDSLNETADSIATNGVTKKQWMDGIKEAAKTVGDTAWSVLLEGIDSQNMVEIASFYSTPLSESANDAWVTMQEQRGAIQNKYEQINELRKKHEPWYEKYSLEGARLLSTLIYDMNIGTTLTQVDGTLSKAEALQEYKNDFAKIEIWNKQQKLIKKLKQLKVNGVNGMTIYTDMRDFFVRQQLDIEKTLLTEVENVAGKDTAKKVKKDIFSKLFDRKNLAVYFPLVRQGRYKVSWHSISEEAAGRDPHAMIMVDTKAEADRLVELLKKDPDVDTTGLTSSAEIRVHDGAYSSADIKKKAPPSSFIREVVAKIEEGGVTPEKEKLVDELIDLFLNTLPETSFAQSFRKRKGIAGYIADANYAFNNKAYDISRQSVRVQYSRKLRRIEDRINNIKYPQDAEFTESKFGIVKKKLSDAIRYAYNPPSGTIENIAIAVNQFAFLQTISYNVSSAVVQTFQTPFITYPYLAGEYGYVETSKTMSKASALVSTSFDIEGQRVPEVGIDTYFDVVRDKDGEPTYVLKEKHKKNLKANSSRLKDLNDLQHLVKIGRERNQLNRTFFQDLMSIDQSGKDVGQTRELWRKFMGVGAALFNTADRFNRQVAMVSAYQLELNRLRKAKKGQELSVAEMEQAAADAIRMATETNGGTFIETGPSIAKQHIGRVAAMYKTYGFKMYYLLFKNAAQMFGRMIPPGTPNREAQIRKAWKMFTGNMLITGAVAGAQALPIYGAIKIVGALQDLFEGEDENLDDTIRMALGEGWYKGGISELAGIDISDRLKLNGLIIQENKFNTRITFENALFTNLLGPAGSTIKGFAGGVGDVINPVSGRYDIERGIERMLPPAFGNMYKSMVRYQREGYRTRSGNPIYEDVTAGELMFQFYGFPPTNYIRNQEEGLIRAKINKNIINKRSRLLKKLHVAYFNGDMKEYERVSKKVEAFNAKHVGRFRGVYIGRKVERRSRKAFARQRKLSYNGVNLSPLMERELVNSIDLSEEYVESIR